MTTKTIISILSVSIILLLVLCIWLAFMLIDTSISYTYMKASVDEDGQGKELYQRLLEKEIVGISEAELIEKLQWQIKNSEDKLILKKEDNYIIFENIRFEIENGKLKDIL